MDTNQTMTAETQTEAPSAAHALPEAGGHAQHVSFAGALLGFMLTTTLTTSIMVLLSQG